MSRKLLTLPLLLFLCLCTRANDPVDSLARAEKARQLFLDSVDNAMKYSTGKVSPEGGKIALDVPGGFKYLNKEQSRYVITKLWGNPETTVQNVVGMLFPDTTGPLSGTYAFVITYKEDGHIKDEDAGTIDYEKILKDMQDSEKEENENRKQAGYPPVHIVGWAEKPYYDKEKKVLHWAQEIHFGDQQGSNTLNYEIRILGRNGMISLNAVGKMDDLPVVNKDIDKVLNVATFTNGNSYKDFDPKIDKVAAWTIGGLVAGKLLLKVGFFAGFLKVLAPLWKFIVLFFAGIGAWFKKRLGRKKEPDLSEYYPATVHAPAAEEPAASNSASETPPPFPDHTDPHS
jgi:uncharacterized membrane-anchored protein